MERSVDKSVFRYRRSVRGVWVLGLGSGDGLGHGRDRLRLTKVVVGPVPRSETIPASDLSHPFFCLRPLCDRGLSFPTFPVSSALGSPPSSTLALRMFDKDFPGSRRTSMPWPVCRFSDADIDV
jgi:hypothetical protein